MSVHETTHHHKTKHDLKSDKDVVYAVHWDLVRVLYWLNEGYDAEGNNKENCEDNEGYQFRELKGYF